jgi:hypothetical protein
MAILDRVTRAMARIYQTAPGRPKMNDWGPRKIYEMLEAYYYSNCVYDAIVDVANADISWAKSMLELKNPTFAVVEFYAKKLWPGTLPDGLPIKTDHKKIIPAIEHVWQWSNWSAKKTVAARYAALYGDMFLRVSVARDESQRARRVYLQIINPRNVTDFRLDERGVIVFLRYDVQRVKTNSDNTTQKYWHTEAWDTKEYRRWDTATSADQSIASLGTPIETIPLTQMGGIDFVPWVHAPFCDTADTEAGDQRGMAAIWPCLTKIDHLHLSVARLGQLLFRYNRPTWAVLANALDPNGRPMPAPKLDSYQFDLDGEKVYHFPGMSKMESLIADVNYEAHAKYIADLYEALKVDLPELRYYEVMQQGNESGIALAFKLAPAIDRIVEVRGALESALIRAQKMALTIGAAAKLEGFSGIGTYEAGDFEHSFEPREVFPRTVLDTAKLVEAYTRAKMPLATAMREFVGWPDEKIQQLQVDMNTEASIREVPNIGALPSGLSDTTRVAITTKAKDVLSSRTQGSLDGVLNDVADKGAESMLASGALAKVLEKNAGKKVRV